ncbi:MAG: DegV family protein [Acholeplasmataceae bacterium]
MSSRKVGVVVDSTFRLDEAYVKENNIGVASLKVMIGDAEYVDGAFDPELVVKALHEHIKVKTSQPSPDLFIEAYKKQLETYDEVVCLTISKSLSGTFNSANLAQTILDDERVIVIDTESAISGSLYLTEKLVEFLNEGKSAREASVYIETLKAQGSVIFTVDNLQTLHDNGRLSRLQAAIGNILKIKPILRFRRGVLEVEQKVRGFSKAAKYLVDEVKNMIDLGKKAIVRIAFVDKSVEAKELELELFQLGEQVDVKITGLISPVVSAHVGLGGLGIYLAFE